VKTFTVNAADTVGNGTSRTVGYRVVYPFTGFFAPVANAPTLNSVRAASTVPVAFSLGGNRGMAIFATGAPSVQQIDCTTRAPIGAAGAASGTLAYSATNSRYTYSWTTSSTWVGTCQQLVVTLADGTVHLANFRFT
jgi:hypothetical protein